jgi:hypothetical protein
MLVTHQCHGWHAAAGREAWAGPQHGRLASCIHGVVTVEGCGRLKQLEDDHGKAVNIHLQVVGLMPVQCSIHETGAFQRIEQAGWIRVSSTRVGESCSRLAHIVNN